MADGTLRTAEVKMMAGDRYISLRIFCAELLGTALFIYFGNGALTQVVVGNYFHDNPLNVSSNPKANDQFDYGDYLTVALGYGLGLTLALASCGAVSGGHLNPAVTLTEVLYKRLPATVLPVYVIAQSFGAFIGIGFVYTIHSVTLRKLQEKDKDASIVYFTGPVTEQIDQLTMAWDQFVGSATYMFVYLAMDDKYTGIKSKPLRVVVLGATYMLILLALGLNTGASINPVRDLVPRIFSYLISNASAFTIFALSTFFMPFLGCLTGGTVYELAIRFLRPEETEDEEKLAMEDIMRLLDELEVAVRGLKSQEDTMKTTTATSFGETTMLDDTKMEGDTTSEDSTLTTASNKLNYAYPKMPRTRHDGRRRRQRPTRDSSSSTDSRTARDRRGGELKRTRNPKRRPRAEGEQKRRWDGDADSQGTKTPSDQKANSTESAS